jgi:hypothetical protein
MSRIKFNENCCFFKCLGLGAGVELAEKIILPPGGSSRRGKKLKSGLQRTILKNNTGRKGRLGRFGS